MRLAQLTLLLTVAETGSLRAAAQVLNLTQPALTKALKLLEDELGAQLVLRSAQGARLAPAGELLAARAAAALRELERGREEVAAWAGSGDARVTVGLSPTAAWLLAPGAVARLAARWPGIQVRLVDSLYPRALAQVRAGELDFAIGPVPGGRADRDLTLRPLLDSRSQVVVRRGHPLARVRTLAALADARWVLTGPAGGPGDPAALGFDRLGLRPPRPWLTCESFSTVLAMVSSHDVVCVMPQRFVERHGARLGLARVPVTDPLPRATVQAAWRRDAPLTVPAQRLLDAFEQEARERGALPEASEAPLA